MTSFTQPLKLIRAFLTRHGHNKEHLNNLNEKALDELYTNEVRKNTLDFIELMNDGESFAIISAFEEPDIGEFKTKVREKIDDTFALLDVIKDGLDDFGYNDIADILSISVKNISTHKLQRILRIAYHEYQEILLARIGNALKDLPIEEYKVIMNRYEHIRNNLTRLKEIIEQLADETKREQILGMAHLKLRIVEHFMPEEVFGEIYKEYLDNTPEKLKLVDEVLKLTKMHSKPYLKNLPMDELMAMRDELVERKKQDEIDQKIFKQYTQMLDEAMYGADEPGFNEVCLRILTSLNQRQILMISDYLNPKNPIFVNRFNTLLRDFKKHLKS